MTGVRSLEEIDLTDPDHFANGFPHDLFALHRPLPLSAVRRTPRSRAGMP